MCACVYECRAQRRMPAALLSHSEMESLTGPGACCFRLEWWADKPQQFSRLHPPPNPSTRAVHGCLAFTWCSCFQSMCFYELSHFLALRSTAKETHFTAQALNPQSSCLTQALTYLELQVCDTRSSYAQLLNAMCIWYPYFSEVLPDN